MEQIYVQLVIEAIKFAGTVIPALATDTIVPEISTPDELPTSKQQVSKRAIITYKYAFDKEFLQNVIRKATGQLSNVIEVATNNIIEEIRRQYIQGAIQEVQARVNVLRQLLRVENLEQETAMQVILGALNPLQVSIEIAKLRLREQKEEDIWNLCYFAGMTTLIAGYTFINQDMPELKAELRGKLMDLQAKMLDDVARKTYAVNGEFHWEKVPLLLSPDGANELEQLYNSTINPPALIPAPNYDVAKMSVNEIKNVVADIVDANKLKQMLNRERRTRYRTRAVELISARMKELKH